MRQMFTVNTRKVLLSCLIMTSPFSYASEKDWLSGEYTILLSDSQKEEYSAQEIELPNFKVKKVSGGWVIEQNGDELKLNNASTEADFYSEAFPDNQNDKEMQCGISGSVILCHLTPLSNIEEDITLSTGYFIIKRDFGHVELTKLQ